MPKRNKIDLYAFYYHYHNNMTQIDLMEMFDIKASTYQQYVTKLSRMKFKLDTDFLVKELLLSYHVPEEISKTKMAILKELVNIWKVKHKVPTTSKGAKFDFSTLAGEPVKAAK